MTEATATVIAAGIPVFLVLLGAIFRGGQRLGKIDGKLGELSDKIDSLPCHDCPIVTPARRSPRR
jgi:hypothetical protein